MRTCGEAPVRKGIPARCRGDGGWAIHKGGVYYVRLERGQRLSLPADRDLMRRGCGRVQTALQVWARASAVQEDFKEEADGRTNGRDGKRGGGECHVPAPDGRVYIGRDL